LYIIDYNARNELHEEKARRMQGNYFVWALLVPTLSARLLY